MDGVVAGFFNFLLSGCRRAAVDKRVVLITNALLMRLSSSPGFFYYPLPRVP